MDISISSSRQIKQCTSTSRSKMIAKLLTLLAALTAVLASPLPRSHEKILYDQRQEGDWNIRADLQNFAILIIPTPANSTADGGSLLDFIARAAPSKFNLMKKLKHQKQSHDVIEENSGGEETQHFIEAKSAAPYKVDITKSRSHLAKLHPETIVLNNDDVFLAKSPNLSLVRSAVNALNRRSRGRVSRAYIVTVPEDKEFLFKTKTEGNKKELKKDSKKKTIKEHGKETKNGSKQINEENECPHGQVKDSYGDCKSFPK